jgi:hypothetical protein
MDEIWPKAVVDFEAFLESKGLLCEDRFVQGIMDNKIVQYGNEDIKIQIACDRSVWGIEVTHSAFVTKTWKEHPAIVISKSWDLGLIRSLLCKANGAAWTLDEQFAFTKANWNAILDLFSSQNREETSKQLERLGDERARHLFPKLYGQEHPSPKSRA